MILLISSALAEAPRLDHRPTYRAGQTTALVGLGAVAVADLIDIGVFFDLALATDIDTGTIDPAVIRRNYPIGVASSVVHWAGAGAMSGGVMVAHGANKRDGAGATGTLGYIGLTLTVGAAATGAINIALRPIGEPVGPEAQAVGFVSGSMLVGSYFMSMAQWFKNRNVRATMPRVSSTPRASWQITASANSLGVRGSW